MSRWMLKRNAANIRQMTEDLSISPVLAHVLANMGINTRSSAVSFLYPDFSGLCDETKLKDIEKAAKIIYAAVSNYDKIAVYGDYDVDGVVSTYMLYSELKSFGADVMYFLPHREDDGYGLNLKSVDMMNGLGVKLIITCDNGIAAIEEVKHARSLGIKTVILDHHEVKYMTDSEGIISYILPEADAVVDPKQVDCEYEYKNICAATLCFKFLKYFHSYLGTEFENEEEMLCFAAIASVCDIVELRSESRIIVKKGLELLNQKSVNRGLSALIKLRMPADKKLTVFTLGYVIGPCLNAAGRLSTADFCLKLFLAENDGEAESIAKRLEELNEERKLLTSKYLEEAMNDISENTECDKVIVYYNPNGHESLSGIVAGKIKEATCHPAIVLTPGGGLVKGSARSIEGYNMFEALSHCSDLFVKFGGHEMAAGMTLAKENVEQLRKRLNDNCTLSETDFTPLFRIDKELSLKEITKELAVELRRLEPHGNGNQTPIFGTKGVLPDSCEIIGETRKTLRFILTVGDKRRQLKCICFNRVNDFAKLIEKKLSPEAVSDFLEGKLTRPKIEMDIIYCIEINEFNGSEYLQLRLVDFR